MRKTIFSACIAAALFMIVMIPMRSAKAEVCYYYNPLWYPFAVAGAVVNGAVIVATAPFQPFFYGYERRVWVPGHFTYRGHWICGHWRYYR